MIRDRILSRLEEISKSTLNLYLRKAHHSNPEDNDKFDRRQRKMKLAKQKLSPNGKSKIGAN